MIFCCLYSSIFYLCKIIRFSYF